MLVSRQQIGKHCERRRLRVGRRRMLVGGIGRSRALCDHLVAVVRLGVIGRGGNSSVRKPVGRVLGRRDDRRASELLGVGEIGAHDSPGGLGQQLLRRLAFDLGTNGRRRDAQSLRQPHGVARHVLACEWLDLGSADGARKQDQEDGERAQSVKHVQLSK